MSPFRNDILKGKRILVTGGGTGLGKEMSVGFAAHGVVGGLVRHALANDIQLSEIGRDELAGFSELLDDEYYEVLAEGSWLDSKLSRGGTSSAAVSAQLELARESLAELAR